MMDNTKRMAIILATATLLVAVSAGYGTIFILLFGTSLWSLVAALGGLAILALLGAAYTDWRNRC